MTQDNWISVKRKKKPKEGQYVLCFAPDCHIIGSILLGLYFDDNNSWTVYDFSDSKLNANVTHWQPLPKPPIK